MVSKVAVFIDAENMNADMAQQIFQKAASWGTIVERRAYGDFCNAALVPWVSIAAKHAISLQTTVRPIANKNSSDIAMAIDVIEMLCRNDIDIFCLASSDSDFTQVAMRIRMRGKKAIGLGEAKTSPVLRDAFDQFFEVGKKNIQNVVKLEVSKSEELITNFSAPHTPQRIENIVPFFVNILRHENKPEYEWMRLNELGQLIKKYSPDFDYKNFEAKNLSDLLRKIENNKKVQIKGDLKQMQIKIAYSNEISQASSNE